MEISMSLQTSPFVLRIPLPFSPGETLAFYTFQHEEVNMKEFGISVSFLFRIWMSFVMV